MRFEISNAGELINPSATQIADALAALPGGGESFVILASGPQTYVQAAGSPKEGFIVEYRDGSEDRHFEVAGSSVDLQLATSIFQRYAVDDTSWKGLASWQPWGTASHIAIPSPLKGLLIIGALAVAGGLLFAFAN